MYKTASCPLILSTFRIISFTPEEEHCLRHRGIYFYLQARLPLRTSDPCVHFPPCRQHLLCLRSTSNLTSSKLNSFYITLSPNGFTVFAVTQPVFYHLSIIGIYFPHLSFLRSLPGYRPLTVFLGRLFSPIPSRAFSMPAFLPH